MSQSFQEAPTEQTRVVATAAPLRSAPSPSFLQLLFPSSYGGSHPKVKPRRLRVLDFWRGIALLAIFLNHLPENRFTWITWTHWGFSDAAAVFFFLSGFVSCQAYASILERHGVVEFRKRLMKRLGTLYVWHIGLCAFCIACLLLYSWTLGQPMAFENNERNSWITDNPGEALWRTLILNHAPPTCVVLMAYVALIALIPVLFWAKAKSPALLILGSAAVWAAAHAFPALNFPFHGSEMGWIFNPFAWQFVFTLGFVAGHLCRAGVTWGRVSPLLLAAAVGMLVLCGLVRHDVLPLDVIGDNKFKVGPSYILHFVLLALVARELLPADRLLDRIPGGTTLETLGRHALLVFAFTTALTYVLSFWRGVSSLSPLMIDIGQVLVGGLLVTALARFLKTKEGRKAPQSPLGLARGNV